MTGHYKKAIDDLEEEIKELTYEQGNSLMSYEKTVELILDKIAELKDYVLKRGFKSQQEEIHFFKQIKPLFIAKLIYYNSIYRIETKRSHGGGKIIKKYFYNELSKIRRYFDSNFEFYRYYRTNSVDSGACSPPIPFYVDPSFRDVDPTLNLMSYVLFRGTHFLFRDVDPSAIIIFRIVYCCHSGMLTPLQAISCKTLYDVFCTLKPRELCHKSQLQWII